MAKVLGIGGVFWKTADPKKTAAWYREVLGFDMQDWGGAVFEAPQLAQQVWSTFPTDSQHFAPSTLPVMVNLVVDDLDGVLVRAEAAGFKPLDRDDGNEYGRFAWIMDPDGVKLELWQAAKD